MVVNGKGTWNPEMTVFTLASGKAMPMPDGDASLRSAREGMLKLGDARRRAAAAAGKGPKGKTAGQRDFAAWVMKAGYG